MPKIGFKTAREQRDERMPAVVAALFKTVEMYDAEKNNPKFGFYQLLFVGLLLTNNNKMQISKYIKRIASVWVKVPRPNALHYCLSATGNYLFLYDKQRVKSPYHREE